MELGWKKRMKKSTKYHWKTISLIIHLKINEYLLKYFQWHLSDIELSLQSVSSISLKFQRSFQTVRSLLPHPNHRGQRYKQLPVLFHVAALYPLWDMWLAFLTFLRGWPHWGTRVSGHNLPPFHQDVWVMYCESLRARFGGGNQRGLNTNRGFLLGPTKLLPSYGKASLHRRYSVSEELRDNR